jgi:HK97 family phage prohead protease
MDIERRNFNVAGMKSETRDDGKRIMRGHAAIFDSLSEDLGGFREQIQVGAFADAVKNDDVRALFNHDPNLILGRSKAGTLRLTEDAQGLAIEIDPPDTQYARDLMVSMERGDISQMSFGFSVRAGGQSWSKADDGRKIRTLTSLRLFDVSPVTYPAYASTDIALRSLAAHEAGFEIPWKTKIARRRLDLI